MSQPPSIINPDTIHREDDGIINFFNNIEVNQIDNQKNDIKDPLMMSYTNYLSEMFSQRPHTPTYEDIDVQRRIYLSIINTIDEGKTDEAHERLNEIIKNAISNEDLGIKEPSTETYINVHFYTPRNHAVIQTKLSTDKKRIQIGRHHFCDIVPSIDYQTLSRIHLTIVHFIDELGVKKFALIDMGSLLGIREIDDYTAQKPEIIARQNKGVPWLRSVGESIHLKLGVEITVFIQTSDTFEEIPDCTVCLNEKRIIKFEPCNHFATCFECSKKVNECPICKMDITKKRRLDNYDVLCTYQH
jgi:hypothetical protein